MFKQQAIVSPASLISILASAILVAGFGLSISNLISSASNAAVGQSQASISSIER